MTGLTLQEGKQGLNAINRSGAAKMHRHQYAALHKNT
jgi:hypothetical protein